MKPTNEEVYRALITLKNLCSETEICSDCPLFDESINMCGVERVCPPKYWEINCVSEWKAFE